MSMSGTYNFSTSLKSEQLILDAYERIGVIPALEDSQKIKSAQRSLNFILQEWATKGNNLWTIRYGMIGLTPNQSAYSIPVNGIDLKTVAIRQSNRNLGGTPASDPGGDASLAFDGNPNTACTQTGADGYISYNWGSSTNVTSMVGVQSNASVSYTLACECSSDGNNWTTLKEIPIQVYPEGQIQWFSIPVPTPSIYFRIQETGGATLDIQELYFNTNTQDLTITRMSEAEYTSNVQKNIVGRPTGFYVDRQISPIIYLWPTPSAMYNNLYFSYWNTLQDIGSMLDSAEVPARFLEPLCAALAFKLAIKNQLALRMPIEAVTMLGAIADQAYMTANVEDRERVPLRVYPGLTQGYSYE